MPSAYWGAGQALSLQYPETWQGWLLLFGYALLSAILLFHDRKNLQQFSPRRGFIWLVLGVAALVVSQLFPITLSPYFLPLIPEGGESISVSLLATVPSLLAGLVLGPGPALLVGMSAGLGRALGGTHQPYDLFLYAFGAWLAACLLQLNYRGKLYSVLRNPIVSGTVSNATIALMTGFTVFVVGNGVGLLSRLDLALAAVLGSLIRLLVEGFAGGVIVMLIMLALPASVRRTGGELLPTPGQSSVQHYLLTNLVLFSGAVLVVVVAAAVLVTTSVSTRLIVAELAARANASTAQMAGFHAQIENNLAQFQSGDAAVKVDERALSRFYRDAGHYEQVLVVNGDEIITDGYPEPTPDDKLTSAEIAAIEAALQQERSSIAVNPGEALESSVSMIMPLKSAPESEKEVLVGRVKRNSLAKMLDEVAANQNFSGAIVNLDGAPLVEVGAESIRWSGIGDAGARPIFIDDEYGGEALLSENGAGERQLIYLGPSVDRMWRVAVSAPYEIVLKQALGVSVPLILALVVLAGVFYTRLASYSRNLSGSINELTRTSREIAEGVPVAPHSKLTRHDEIGELGRAILDLQRGVKKRLDELSLLLSVSRESSTSFELADSFPVVIQGALRGTGASGVRALVVNPAGSRLITFTEGPAADGMDILDHKLMSLLRQEDKLVLSSPQSIREHLGIDSSSVLSINALYALPLEVEGKFLGVFAVGFRDGRAFSENDASLLQSLARQASVLVQKSYLYTYAEGGRRRLAAVLASTSEAVIVTDQTSRIVVINRAMEEAFSLKMQQVVGRAVADVIGSASLVSALSNKENDRRDLEVQGVDGRTYIANTSTIINHEGHVQGRVAVLHDVTNLKEIDRLKSEFVDNVSHDLRTPLTILSGYASALSMMDDLSPEQRLYADKILRSVERMIELVENLLDLGRIESGVDLVFEKVDITPLLRDIADEHWLFAHDSGVRLHTRVGEGVPPVRCDRTLLRQAISNLLMNGFKYAPGSGDMTLAAECSGEEVWISVRDRGPGIAKTDQLRLFEKFYRVKRHGAGDSIGSGLGLAMVKGIAERHGGRAWCESEPGKGSTFYISLPVEGIEDPNC